ncbi:MULTISPECIES: hypothetical protein [Methylobacterium]|uniref:Uncharacterized protein n=1 Tax=Methylobacterium jeotgali TaxID=381630 RepID=A0ABQ4SQD2_9HYPH|nr:MULTISPECIES: hypothetical protein [Methylobacterium]PIU05455.1 MAG: hypothetical protein COT56_14980 [Methylobacterium sp. CG09_land_8_20_14_0_10_71_15]PIU13006.1 MAG: hypothetical protein COT28_13070 [Methylobacterium sp. CG08_land_8_20_14_0_20_71_15]GBU15851.1 hypothetical protein AwMethylo_00660 [Methylobacterium sp.]GJE05307.1 hypothetical protein AOPFMNJM_0605 [Methylobacterium jeotgali]
MACIHRFKRPLGPGQLVSWTGVYKEGFASREAAAAFVEAHVASYQVHGYNGEEGYWWYREASASMTTIFAVCSDGQSLVIG